LVDQTEIPEPVHEHVHHAHHDGQGEGFRRLAAIYVGVVAMLLAISALGGGKATKEMLSANIHASDTYAFAQAKYLRQTANELAADQLEFELNHLPGLSDEGKAKAAERVQHYRGNAARYASDPTTGEGREQLLAKAKEWEAIRRTRISNSPRRCSRSRLCSARSRSSRRRPRFSASVRSWPVPRRRLRSTAISCSSTCRRSASAFIADGADPAGGKTGTGKG
jgi:Domain of unknown function (DUF4337)